MHLATLYTALPECHILSGLVIWFTWTFLL